MLRDKVAILEEEIDRINISRMNENELRMLQDENQNLKRAMFEKDEIFDREMMA